MFSLESNASKVGFFYLVSEMEKRGYKIIDCQMHTAHLESLGAEEIPRDYFIQLLEG